MSKTLTQHQEALLHRAYKHGGFPMSKSRYLRTVQEELDLTDFNNVTEAFRKALMMIESENLTMEQISSVAHICGVVAIKLGREKD